MGKFEKGNPGKPKGAIHTRTRQWDALGESITGQQADQFNGYLRELWESPDPDDRQAAAELFLKILEYFKPKHARVTHAGDVNEPVQIIIPPSV
jgi:hypothetical protein